MTLSPDSSSPPIWPGCGLSELGRDALGHAVPTPDYWRVWLRRPELALVEESCVAEQGLHEALVADPLRSVLPGQIEAIRDPDVRDNFRLYLAFRDTVQRAGTLEAAWCGFFRSGAIQVPPLFLDLLVQAIAGRALADSDDAWEWRAAELLFRRQRVRVQDGRVLLGDADTLDRLNETGGLGSIGLHLLDPTVPLGPPRKATSAPAALVDALVGDYEIQGGMKLTLRRQGEALEIQAQGQPAFEMGHDSAGDFYPLAFDALLKPVKQPDGSQSFAGEYLTHDSKRVTIRRADGRVFTLEAGDSYVIDTGEPHSFSNPSGETCRIVSAHTPASF